MYDNEFSEEGEQSFPTVYLGRHNVCEQIGRKEGKKGGRKENNRYINMTDRLEMIDGR